MSRDPLGFLGVHQEELREWSEEEAHSHRNFGFLENGLMDSLTVPPIGHLRSCHRRHKAHHPGRDAMFS